MTYAFDRQVGVKIPARLRRRPMFRGFPVPANVVIDPQTGAPDFATIDVARSVQLMEGHQCALCGESLNRWFAIIGGRESFHHHLFRDGPMHEECARFALITCPFLANPDHGYRAAYRDHEGYASAVVAVGAKPERQGLFFAREYQMFLMAGETVVQVGAFKRAEWWRGGERVEYGGETINVKGDASE